MKFYLIQDSAGWTSPQLFRKIDSATYIARYLVQNVRNGDSYYVDILEIDSEQETVSQYARLNENTLFDS